MDATDFANSLVQQRLEAAGAAPSEPVSNPEPLQSASATTPSRPKLKVRSEHPVPADSVTPGEAAPPSPPSSRPAAPMLMPPSITPLLEQNQGLGPRFFLGMLGGVLGVIIGCLIWYAFVHFTGKNFRIIAVVVGIAAGFGTKLFSKDLGKSELGSITGAFVLLGIIFTAYMIGRERIHNYVGGLENDIFRMEMEYAKRVVAAVPNGTEQEIRMFLAKEYAEEDGVEQPDPAAVSRRDVRLFKEVRLNRYRDIASGKLVEKNYLKNVARWTHEENVAEAKYALSVIPTGSDREIHAYLTETYIDLFGEKPDAIGRDEINQFRTQRLPELRALANGERPLEENQLEYKSAQESLDDYEKSNEGGWTKFIYFFSGWGFGGLGVAALAIGLAYKICTHAD